MRGVKIECQAFKRDGGGGYVTIYRRFGSDPVRPEISAKATIAADQASGEIKIEDDRKAAEALQFAEWYQDPTIPKNVNRTMGIRRRSEVVRHRAGRTVCLSHDDDVGGNAGRNGERKYCRSV